MSSTPTQIKLPVKPQEWTSEPIKVLEVFKDTLFAGAGSNVMIWSLLKDSMDHQSDFNHRLNVNTRSELIQPFSERWTITSISCVACHQRVDDPNFSSETIQVLVTTLYSYRIFIYDPLSKTATMIGTDHDAMYGEILAGHCFDESTGEFLVYDTNNQVVLHEFLDETEVMSVFSGSFGAPDSVKITGESTSDVLIFVSSSATVNICTLESSDGCRILTVLHTFNQEKGVIFSIQFYPKYNLILTTSDERSIALWKCIETTIESSNYSNIKSHKNLKVELQAVLEGHTARVFNALLIQDDKIVSIGEDSNVVAWPLKDPDRHFVIGNHKGSTIWSCAYHKNSGNFFTCGDDGSILTWDLSLLYNKDKMNEHELYAAWTIPSDFPRLVKAFDLTSALVSTNSGRVFLTSEKEVLHKNESSSWTKYLTLALSPDKSMYVIGTFAGSISFNKLYKHLNQALVSENSVLVGGDMIENFEVELPKQEKVISIHFLDRSQSQLLVSTITLLLLYELDCFNERAELPQVKLKWSVKQKSNVNCVEKLRNVIYTGLDNGKIKAYDASTGEKLYKFKARHNKFGVGGIVEYRGQLVTGGRDSTLNFFFVDNDNDLDNEGHANAGEVTHLKTVPLPFLWVGSFVKYKDDLLVCGFESRDFIIYSLKREQILGRANCGGAHRSWDFSVRADGNAIFTHIRTRKVYKSTFDLEVTRCIKEGFHLDDINSCIEIPTTSDTAFILATASEDCAVKVNTFGIELDARSEPGFVKKLTETIANHTSAVRCLHYHETTKNSEGFLISGGGRSELIITKLYFDGIRLRKYENIHRRIFEGELDFRVMDVNSISTTSDQDKAESHQSLLFVFAACSDGILRVLQPNENTKSHYSKLQGFYRKLTGTGHCLTSVQLLHDKCPSTKTIQVFSGTSAGEFIVWILTPSLLFDELSKDVQPIRILQTHTISITSLCVNRCKNSTRLLIGGDDGSLCEISCDSDYSKGALEITRFNLTNDSIFGTQFCKRPSDAVENVYFISGSKLYQSTLDKVLRIKCVGIPIQDGKGIVICKPIKICDGTSSSSDGCAPIVSFGKGLSVFTI